MEKFAPPGAVSFFTLRIDDPFERASYSRKASNQSQSCCPFFKMAENVVLYSSTLKALSALSIYMQSLALSTIVGCFRLELRFTKSRVHKYKTISGTLRYLNLWYVFVHMCSIASLKRWMLTPKLSVTAITIRNSDTMSTLGVELVVYWIAKSIGHAALMGVELGTSWVKDKCPIQ